MNMILDFFDRYCDRLYPGNRTRPQKFSCVFLTPGFQASSHIIVFVLQNDDQIPSWVVKLPRLAGDHQRLDLEAANLRLIHSKKAGGFDSIPQVVAYEDFHQFRLLVQSMLHGRIMRPPLVRRRPDGCILAATNWLLDIHRITADSSRRDGDGPSPFPEDALRLLESILNQSGEQRLLEKTRGLLAPVCEMDLPTVFEHGDFSSPNLLLDDQDRLGVVDWELADPHGLPMADLFFFLTYVAFARTNAVNLQQQLQAVRQVFFDPNSWARSVLLDYAGQTGIPAAWLSRLFLLTWIRYLANMIRRLTGGEAQLSEETARWLRTNRYYHIWQETAKRMEHFVIPAGT